MFSVKSTYEKLLDLVIAEDRWQEDEKMVFEGIWKSAAPLKVIVFSWKALLNRIPTKSNLRIRNVFRWKHLLFVSGAGEWRRHQCIYSFIVTWLLGCGGE